MLIPANRRWLVLSGLAAITVLGCTAAAEQEAFRKIRAKGGRIELHGSGPEVIFSNVNITNDDLSCLEGLPHLHALRLEHVEVTDEGLKHLLPIGQFDTLRIRHTKITQKGIEKLKEKFPQLEVRYN